MIGDVACKTIRAVTTALTVLIQSDQPVQPIECQVCERTARIERVVENDDSSVSLAGSFLRRLDCVIL
jgi:hypothetical protein